MELPLAGDSFDEAFAKAVAKLNQIGNISNGQIDSKSTVDTSSSTPITRFSLSQGALNFNATKDVLYSYQVELSRSTGLAIQSNGNPATGKFEVSPLNFEHRTNECRSYSISNSKIVDAEGLTVYSGAAFLNNKYTALSAKTAGSYTRGCYDAFFGNIKLGSLVLDAVSFATDNVYITSNTSMVLCNNNKNNINVYLPSNPEAGRIIFIIRNSNGGVNVIAQGSNGIDQIGKSEQSVGISSRGQTYIFIFQGSVSYNGESRVGLWSWAKLGH